MSEQEKDKQEQKKSIVTRFKESPPALLGLVTLILAGLAGLVNMLLRVMEWRKVDFFGISRYAVGENLTWNNMLAEMVVVMLLLAMPLALLVALKLWSSKKFKQWGTPYALVVEIINIFGSLLFAYGHLGKGSNMVDVISIGGILIMPIIVIVQAIIFFVSHIIPRKIYFIANSLLCIIFVGVLLMNFGIYMEQSTKASPTIRTLSETSQAIIYETPSVYYLAECEEQNNILYVNSKKQQIVEKVGLAYEIKPYNAILKGTPPDLPPPPSRTPINPNPSNIKGDHPHAHTSHGQGRTRS